MKSRTVRRGEVSVNNASKYETGWYLPLQATLYIDNMASGPGKPAGFLMKDAKDKKEMKETKGKKKPNQVIYKLSTLYY